MKQKIKKLIATIISLQLLFGVPGFSQTPTGVSPLKEFISATYTYLSGMLVMQTDKDGNRVFYERGMVRYVLDKNGNLLSFNVFGTDNVTSFDSLCQLISSRTGKSVQDVKKMFEGGDGTDEKGNIVNKRETPNWLNEAISWTAGVNRSISIDFTAQGGASCTFIENGRPVYAKAHDGELIAQWVYNPDGSLKEVWQLQYQPAGNEVPESEAKNQDGSLKSGYYYDPATGKYYNQNTLSDKSNLKKIVDGGKEYYFKRVWTKTTYVNGRASSVYEIGDNGATKLVGFMEYASNGDLIAVYDLKNNRKTIYAQGKPQAIVTIKDQEIKSSSTGGQTGQQTSGSTTGTQSQTGSQTSQTTSQQPPSSVIKAGSIVGFYKYKPNGSLDVACMMDNNGRWTTTAYENGRALITVNGQNTNGDLLRQTYHQILSLAEQAAQGNSNAKIQLQNIFKNNTLGIIAINIYVDQVRNWLAKYGLDKTSEILVYIFCWMDKKVVADGIDVDTFNVSKDMAKKIINQAMEHGINGSAVAFTATYHTTKGNNDSENASFAAAVSVGGYNGVLYDIDASYFDPTMPDIISALAGNVNLQNLLKDFAPEGLPKDGKIDTADEWIAFNKALDKAFAELQKKIRDLQNQLEEADKKMANAKTTEDYNAAAAEYQKLCAQIEALERYFDFDISYSVTVALDENGRPQTETAESAQDAALKTAQSMAKAWKKCAENLLQQVSSRIDNIIAAYNSGEVNLLKSLNQNISVNETYTLYDFQRPAPARRDPTVIGTLQNVVYIDGKWYAVVDANKIDLYDGKGLQNIDGVIYVEIDEELAGELQGKIGQQVLFAGDVREDVNGYLCIKMNKEYGGGYAVGEKDINAYLQARETAEWYKRVVSYMSVVWANIRATYGDYSDWRQGFEFLKAYFGY